MGPPQSSFHTCYGCKVSVGFAAFAFRLQGAFVPPGGESFRPLSPGEAFANRPAHCLNWPSCILCINWKQHVGLECVSACTSTVTCTRGQGPAVWLLQQNILSAQLRAVGDAWRRSRPKSARQCLTEQKSLVLVSATWSSQFEEVTTMSFLSLPAAYCVQAK